MRPTPVLAALAAAFVLSFPLHADEGQWTPGQLATLPEARLASLRARGLALTPAELWDGSGGGLMSAVVSLGGCTAAFVSPEGLLATNHHCAFSWLQNASTEERNVLRDGLVTRSRAEEPRAPGAARAVVLRKVTDVTDRVRGPGSPFAKAKDDHARWEAVETVKKELVAACEKRPDTRCTVASFADGLSFELHEGLELRDLRLVWAPPRAVGDFGGEEDNWSWPRHTADIALVRAYVAPDGRPAAYAKENVPYRPPAWLRVSDEGVGPGSLVAVIGYPGRTQRYLDAVSVEEMERWFYPLRARTAADRIALLDVAAKADPGTALRVASTIKGLANGEKNARGQIAGLSRNGVASRARREEEDLASFLAERPDAAPGAREALPALLSVLAADRQDRDRRYFLEELERSPGLLAAALRAVRWAGERRRPDLEREAGYQDRDLTRAKAREADVTRSLAPAAERKVLAYLVARALSASSPNPPVAALAASFGAGATEAAVEKRLAEWDGRTKLHDETVRLALLTTATPETLAASEDPYVRFAVALSPELERLRRARQELNGALLRLRPPVVAGLQALRASRSLPVYPDANGTLRISFAEVKGYSPREAVTFAPQTTVRGLLEKDRGTEPFALPAAVSAAARAPGGAFADRGLGTVPVNFLADADTTGGNSGSPVVDGRGRLVGLNFDRVFENVAGDFGWSPATSRNVNLDVRYALWLLARVDGAPPVLDELLGRPAGK